MLERSRPVILLLALLALLLTAAAPSTAQTPTRLYLPTVRQAGEPVPNLFGIEMSQLTSDRGLRLMAASGTSWIRRGALNWKTVEPNESGGYNWDSPAIKALEQDMITASQLGANLIVTVYASPQWAVRPYTADCAPINAASRERFARFLAEAVRRYSGPPYNLRYWEIGNEPDATLFPSDSVFGCWGIEGDPYYGGRAYGEMLNAVYPAMKRANPDVVVLNGGLLLDAPYDPANPRTTPGRFFEGMLQAGAGSSFDMVSFHSYTFWRTPGRPALGERVDWRVGYLKELMARYKLPQKPLLRTEGALLCPGEMTPECRWAQADYLSRLFVRAHGEGLAGNIWYVYDNDSYHNTALIEPGDVLVPRPAYFAYRQASRALSGARFVGPLTGVPEDVEGYVLARGADTIVALWSDQPRTVAVPLPAAGAVTCASRDGGTIPCPVEGGSVTVDLQTGATYLTIRR